MIDMCKSRVPASLVERLEAIKADEHAVQQLGIEFGTQLCRNLTAVGAPGLHIYTLNLDHVTNEILKHLGYFKQ